ncbi:MAG: flagellar basal body rod protein FlgC [Candidatus Andeanibacterium colombiense]|uniref:Flagellar basal-body rod protein FlgC n=1 Tax=Candidatus Andeanibacterium colombiense TaxID=3121345 RepID=A0AAJ5X5V5_9SPHN|nr:MAG: flagellar basal body rod protein FlgC [Sphingomonadaceae bacterium]
MDAIAISRSGLDVEWRRMEVIALNLANMESSSGANGKSYVPLRLVSGPSESFDQVLDGLKRPGGVKAYGIEPDTSGTRRVYQPGHPHADAAGFVTYPNISHAEEMTLMVKTARAYEANLVAMAAAQQIYSSALQIGRQQ